MSIPETNGVFAQHYLLQEQLSPGLVEQVWKAEDWSAAGAPVTIRLYAPHLRLDQHSLDLLQREQQQRADLQHPHLLIPTAFGVYEGIPYEVASQQPMQTLAQRLLLQNPLPERDVALVIAQIGSALAYLHTLHPPLAHRRINLSTLLQAQDGGFALAVPALSNQLRTMLHRATGAPAVQDTAYAAPELFGPHPLRTAASDVFAFGVSLYELCTGETPWLGNGGGSLNQGAEIPVVPAPYSRVLSNLVRACLHPDPGKRPSAGTLVEEATYYLEHGYWKPYGAFGDVTAPAIVYKEGPRWLWPALLLLLLTGALAAAYYFFVLNEPNQPDEVANNTGIATNPPDQSTGTDTVFAADTSVNQGKKAPADTPAIPAPAPQKREHAQARPATKPAPARPAQPVYPHPNSLEDYLVGLLNHDIPLQVRDRWRPAIRKYFAPDAIIYTRMHGAPLGSFGVNEFIDILLSTEEDNGIIIDKIIPEQEVPGPIEEMNVSIISVR